MKEVFARVISISREIISVSDLGEDEQIFVIKNGKSHGLVVETENGFTFTLKGVKDPLKFRKSIVELLADFAGIYYFAVMRNGKLYYLEKSPHEPYIGDVYDKTIIQVFSEGKFFGIISRDPERKWCVANRNGFLPERRSNFIIELAAMLVSEIPDVRFYIAEESEVSGEGQDK